MLHVPVTELSFGEVKERKRGGESMEEGMMKEEAGRRGRRRIHLIHFSHCLRAFHVLFQ